MEIFFVATLIVMIVTLYKASQQRQASLCQQEVQITERSARKR